jgi:hypothetical protein
MIKLKLSIMSIKIDKIRLLSYIEHAPFALKTPKIRRVPMAKYTCETIGFNLQTEPKWTPTKLQEGDSVILSDNNTSDGFWLSFERGKTPILIGCQIAIALNDFPGQPRTVIAVAQLISLFTGLDLVFDDIKGFNGRGVFSKKKG